MRLPCPHCGERDLREFTYKGADLPLPEGPDWGPDWEAYLHLRRNPAGETRDLWYHGPCGSWLSVTRNTATHAVAESRPAREPGS
ncbi:sarcosine oxidase subunit delta [Histidinibacterium aquaticum]|uniref:Sarcosine oxidase subunit delta n=1 Tax=Histidinibacterium aquaticum TaxID=2613962 RepID=A0A5J5GSC9_9RHOB|nr:sarcosine oxidase subunit delta [Histidinibacterium aquaticum]KAA9010252.1 sarcosine oxidase subunit delta [Histidinibacterium aquaticum]